MKQLTTIGVVCFGRHTFDCAAAEELFSKVREDLSKIDNVRFEYISELVIEVVDAKRAAATLAGAGIDGLICISGTFHLGHLVLEMNKVLGCPLMLWALPELPYNGGKIRLNSVCGVNLNASNLYKAGIRNYHAHVGPQVDEDWIDAIRIDTAFRRGHIGLAGFRAHGFFNLGVYDPNIYRDYGILVDHYELSELFGCDVTQEEIAERRALLLDTFDASGVTEEQVAKVSELTAKLHKFLTTHDLSALALRCWPEFAADYGISPCAAMSLLQSERRIIACEGDLEGALSMLAHQAIGGETPFLFDFSQVDLEQNWALFWHCGVAPANLWDGQSKRSLDTYFAGGKGVTADFVLRPGDVSILRFDSTAEETRLFLSTARGVPMQKLLKGTYLKVEFERPVSEVLETVVNNGIAHHASMVYGRFVRPLELYARIKGWQVIR